MKLGLILLVVGIACDAGVPKQAPPPVAQTIPPPPHVPVPDVEPPKPHPHEVLATLQRTAYYGTCPIYVVTIYRDGVVEFNGEQYVNTKGKATGHITLAQVDAIEALFIDNHYTSLRDSYEEMEVTDMPSANTSYRSLDGHVKRIGHYHGTRDAPAALATIEEKLDELAGTTQWIETPPPRPHAR